MRIQTPDENRFIAGLVTSRAWLGANDLTTPEQWYWPSATSESDALLWSGGVDGSRPNNLFSNWAKGAPDGKSCASITPGDGHWSDTDCGETLEYVCEYLR